MRHWRTGYQQSSEIEAQAERGMPIEESRAEDATAIGALGGECAHPGFASNQHVCVEEPTKIVTCDELEAGATLTHTFRLSDRARRSFGFDLHDADGEVDATE